MRKYIFVSWESGSGKVNTLFPNHETVENIHESLDVLATLMSRGLVKISDLEEKEKTPVELPNGGVS